MSPDDSAVSTQPPPRPARIDGRRLRSERTKQLIIEAYLALAAGKPRGADADGGADRRARRLFGALDLRALSRSQQAAGRGGRLQPRPGGGPGAGAPCRRRPRRPGSGPRSRPAPGTCERGVALWRVLLFSVDRGRRTQAARSHRPRTDHRAHGGHVPARALDAGGAGAQVHADRARGHHRHRELGAHARDCTACPSRKPARSGSAPSTACCRRRRRLLDAAPGTWDGDGADDGVNRTKQPCPNAHSTASRIDGRRLRSERTKQLIIEAYLGPRAARSRRRCRRPPRSPSAPAIPCARYSSAFPTSTACRSRRSTMPWSRSRRWRRRAISTAIGRPASGPRSRRADAPASAGCRCGARWSSTRASRRSSGSASSACANASSARLELMYAPELSTLSDSERRHLLIVLEALTDVESWARMREFFGLSFEEACAAWMQAIDRLLPPTPLGACTPAVLRNVWRQPGRTRYNFQASTRTVRDTARKFLARSTVHIRPDRWSPPAQRADQAVDHRSLSDAAARKSANPDGGADRRTGGLFGALGVRALSRPACAARRGDGLRLHAGQCAGGARATSTATAQTRLKAHVETRGWICEQWLPLWRALNANKGDSAELKARIASRAPGHPQAHRADVPAGACDAWTRRSAGRS